MTDVPALNQRPETPDDLAMSIDTLKSVFLFGVSFLDDDGNSMSDELFTFYLRSAQEWLQNELDLLIFPTDIVGEALDYNLYDLINYGFLKLMRGPVYSVSRYALQFPLTNDTIEFDPSWFRIDQIGGTISLIPGVNSIEKFLSSQGIGGFLAFYGGDDYVPMTISVDYNAGFRSGKIPADVLELIGMQAALGPLNIAGDLLGGAGIASKSLSVDGLSESISTTSSPEYAGYGARINQYLKQIPPRLAKLRNKYKGIQLTVA